jgi:hypothetical protein
LETTVPRSARTLGARPRALVASCQVSSSVRSEAWLLLLLLILLLLLVLLLLLLLLPMADAHWSPRWAASSCPWGIDELANATYHGTATFGHDDPRSCDGWLDAATGGVFYTDWQGLPCGFVGPDGGKITYSYLHVTAGEAPRGAFDCPC